MQLISWINGHIVALLIKANSHEIVYNLQFSYRKLL